MSFEPKTSLSRAAERVRHSPLFVGSLFDSWENAFGSSIAGALDASPESVDALALCTRPRDDRWAEDIAEIARACSLDEGRLAALMRQALAVALLRTAAPVDEALDGRLLAARDRDEDDQQ
jgi:hypothetical protein